MDSNENPRRIKAVEALPDFNLKISFDNGDRLVDMKTFNLLGIFRKLVKDEALFNTVHLPASGDQPRGSVGIDGSSSASLERAAVRTGGFSGNDLIKATNPSMALSVSLTMESPSASFSRVTALVGCNASARPSTSRA